MRAALVRTATQMHGAFHGRLTRDDSVHLTLVFLGNVDASRLPTLLMPPARIATPKFTLVLDRWGGWRRNRVGWVAPAATPDSLRVLVANLEEWLAGAGYALERRAFAAHVTLVRDAQVTPMPAPMPPIPWPVNDFALVRSHIAAGGSRYEVVGRWPLQREG